MAPRGRRRRAPQYQPMGMARHPQSSSSSQWRDFRDKGDKLVKVNEQPKEDRLSSPKHTHQRSTINKSRAEQFKSEKRKDNDGDDYSSIRYITQLVDRVIALEAELREAHEKMMYLETERTSLVDEVKEWKNKGYEWGQLVNKWLPIFEEIKNNPISAATTMQHAARVFVKDTEFVTQKQSFKDELNK